MQSTNSPAVNFCFIDFSGVKPSNGFRYSGTLTSSSRKPTPPPSPDGGQLRPFIGELQSAKAMKDAEMEAEIEDFLEGFKFYEEWHAGTNSHDVPRCASFRARRSTPRTSRRAANWMPAVVRR